MLRIAKPSFDELRNKAVRAGSRQDGIPHPATIVVDSNGKVCAKLSYSVRKCHSTDELVEAATKVGSR